MLLFFFLCELQMFSYLLSFIWMVAFESFQGWIVDQLECYLQLVEKRFKLVDGGDCGGGRVMKPLSISLWSISVSSCRCESLCSNSSLPCTSVFIITAGQLTGAVTMWRCDKLTVCVSVGFAVSMSEDLINGDDRIKQSRRQLCCLHTVSHKHWLTHNNISWQKLNPQLSCWWM